MRFLHRKALVVAGCSALAVTGLAVAYYQGSSLYISGNLASSSVIQVKGTAYVPVKDVAKALGMSVSRTDRGYELNPAGGAGMVHGTEGKVGDELFNGITRFKVVEVVRGKKYNNRFSGDNQEVDAYPANNDLVVVICRLKNATKGTLPLGLPAGSLTGLTDMDEHSFTPMNGVSTDIPGRGVNLLPGSATDFALTFNVPEGAQLKDLVYDVQDFNQKEKPYRVSLKS